MMDYSKPKIAKSHRFYSKLPASIDDKEYRAKKLRAFRGRSVEEPEESRAIKQRNYLMYILHKEYGVTLTKIAQILQEKGMGIDRSSVGKQIKGYVP